MRTGIKTPPRTIMEVFKTLPEGTLAELIDGTLFMSPAPSAKHQEVILELTFNILGFIKAKKAGRIFNAPFDVFLDEHSNAVQPDIIYVSPANVSVIKEDAIHGVPDILIEVLSQSNSKHDRVKKKELYERFGVKEYWIINPDTKETIGYALKGQTFIELGRYTGNIKSAILDSTFSF